MSRFKTKILRGSRRNHSESCTEDNLVPPKDSGGEDRKLKYANFKFKRAIRTFKRLIYKVRTVSTNDKLLEVEEELSYTVRHNRPQQNQKNVKSKF